MRFTKVESFTTKKHIADRERKRKMLICDKVQQNRWPPRLIWKGHWIPLCIWHSEVWSCPLTHSFI